MCPPGRRGPPPWAAPRGGPTTQTSITRQRDTSSLGASPRAAPHFWNPPAEGPSQFTQTRQCFATGELYSIILRGDALCRPAASPSPRKSILPIRAHSLCYKQRLCGRILALAPREGALALPQQSCSGARGSDLVERDHRRLCYSSPQGIVGLGVDSRRWRCLVEAAEETHSRLRAHARRRSSLVKSLLWLDKNVWSAPSYHSMQIPTNC